jgi:hypothetical protein
MSTAARDYNNVLAILERRVFPEVRRLESLGAFPPGAELPEVPTIDAALQPVAIENYPGADIPDEEDHITAES